MIEIIGAPFDLGGLRTGSRMGPAALRLAGLPSALRDLGQDVADGGDVPQGEGETAPGGMRDFAPLLLHLRELRSRVSEALASDRLPVVLGGEHTVSAASVSAALESREGDLALLWIDAHADVNTPATSDTGNPHGMPIAALQGVPSGVDGAKDFEWRELLKLVGTHRLRPDRTGWLGLRDVDREERPHVRAGLGLTMSDVDRVGIAACVERLDKFFRATEAKGLWISFDVDVLDPVLAPGTGTAVRGGLTYREAHLLAELLYERLQDAPYRLVGLDVVETNPLADSSNATARMAVEWTASLFGKTIL